MNNPYVDFDHREPMPGLLVVDKPGGLTSHDVVARVRRLTGTRKVGHAGTLDPMATGVLVLGIGRATRLLGYLSASQKSYDATIRLGQRTVTDDADGDIEECASAAAVAESRVVAQVLSMTGAIQQVPSKVSAVKIDGERAYRRVRAGQDVTIAARSVRISRFSVNEFFRPTADLLDVDVTVVCSSGTYVRALARDLGAALGAGGHLTRLRRTSVGQFTLDDAVTLEALADRVPLLPLAAAVGSSFPRVDVDEEQAAAIRHGRPIDHPAASGVVGVFGPNRDVLAVMEAKEGKLRVVVGFSG